MIIRGGHQPAKAARFLVGFVLVGALSIGCFASGTGQTSTPTRDSILIDSWITGTPSGLTTAHVVMKNRRSYPLRFAFEFEQSKECEAEPTRTGIEESDTSSPQGDLEKHRWALSNLSLSEGRIPARGWTHRSFLLRGACPVSYRFIANYGSSAAVEVVTGSIESLEARSVELAGIDANDLRVDELVESYGIETDSANPRAVVRVLVENDGSDASEVALGPIAVACHGAESTHAAPTRETLRGEGNGPFTVLPRGRAVFVVTAQKPDDVSYWSECTARAVLVSQGTATQSQRTIEFSLKPVGFVTSVGFRHHR